MKRWLLFFLAILATTLTAVEARPEIPAFVRPGLVVSYVGTVNSDPDYPAFAKTSSQQITVNDVTSNTVRGTTLLTNYLSCLSPCNPGAGNNVIPGNTTVGWTCVENVGCTPDSNQLGTITQFWSSPTNPILTPENNPYILDSDSNPLTCPNGIGACSVYNNTVPPTLGRMSGCVECLLVAVDTTGWVRHFNQLYQPHPTLEGDVGQVIYTFQSMLPPQSDSTSIFWQDSTGTAKISDLEGTTVRYRPSLPKPAPGKFIVGIGDFNGDGTSDILWRNGSVLQNGSVVQDGSVFSIWELDETRIIAQGKITAQGTIINPGPGARWHVVGTGDFNRDGKSDILLQKGTDKIDIWLMNGTERIDELKIPNPNPGPGWHAVGTGDFNLDGESDILWCNETGEVAISEMDGTRVIRTYSIALKPDPTWPAKGAGNFDGTGKSEILLQNITTKQVAIWNGTMFVPIPVDPLVQPGDVVGISDYHSDDPTNPGVDILFQNKSTGAVMVWRMKGTSRIRSDPIASGGFFVMGVGE
jgi:hypothetical protein